MREPFANPASSMLMHAILITRKKNYTASWKKNTGWGQDFLTQ
jgi:hypothetical protein